MNTFKEWIVNNQTKSESKYIYFAQKYCFPALYTAI